MRSSISRVGEGELQPLRVAARFTGLNAATVAPLLVAVAYYAGAEVGFAVRFPSIPTSIVWPPNSILMAALMLTPARRWWVYLLAALPAHLLIQSRAAVPLPAMLFLFVTNAGEAALGAYAVRRLCGGPPRFGHMRDVVVFFVFAVFAAPFVTTFPDAAAVVMTKWGDNFSLVLQARFLSNALTVLTLIPAIVMWAVNGRGWLRAASPRRIAEAGLLALGLGVTYAFAYSESSFGPSFVPAKLYAPLPFLIWAALRFGAGGVCTSLLAVLLISVSYAIGGRGPFNSQSPAADVVGLQLFLIALSVPVMMLAAVTEERRRTAEALKESEARNRAILQAVPDLIFLQTRDGVFLDFHARDAKDLYVPPEQFIGKSVRDVMPPELAERFLNSYRTASESGEPQVVEYALTIGGQERCYEARAVRSNEHVLSIVRDLTERKQAEDALKESENQVRLFVEHTPVAVAMFDREMRYLLTSRRWLKDNNLGEQEIIGRSHYEVVTDIPERWREGHRRCLAGAVERCEEDTFQHPDGTLDWVRWEIRPWYTAGGEIGGIIMFSEMITERKQAEEALRESESRLRLAQQAARVGTWEWDVATGEAVWSEMVWHLLGLEPGDGASNFERFIEFIHPEDLERALRKNRGALAGGAEYENEFRIVRRGGEVLYLALKGRVISSAEGRPKRMIGVNIDITERKRAEQALEQLTGRLLQLQDEERRRLARELHDTTAQNLLAIVLNLETLVRMASTLPKDFSDAVLECQSLCEQTQAEIRTLSYLLHPPMLDEAGLILALEWFIDGFSRRSGIHVDFVAPPDFRRLPSQMETTLFRVVQESLTNIYRHSGSTTAEISLERAGGEVCLRVTDRGRGITAATGNGAGAPGKRAETLGVGISGMRERLRQLGGHLEVRSDGAGTVVAAVLPLGKGEGG